MPAVDLPVFDAHFHVVDHRFPLTANEGYVPPSFTVDDYRRTTAPLGVVGGAVVAGSFHAYGQTWMTDALARLGPSFAGVAQLSESVTDDELAELDRCGVRAARANLRRGMATMADVDRVARRVHEVVGWHIELYVDVAEIDIEPLLRLPSVVIDHLGLDAAGLPALLRLVERGHHVKATGFGRLDMDIASTLRAIAAVDSRALLFGTDLPSTRSPRPFDATDIALVVDTLGPEVASRVLHDNAVALYRPGLR